MYIDTHRYIHQTELCTQKPRAHANTTPTYARSPHRYTCPNGHIYTIGDCGGAMVEATCHECGAKIGGTNHTSAAGNAAAITFLQGVAGGTQEGTE